MIVMKNQSDVLRQFSNCTKDLAKMSGFSPLTIAKYEVGVILKAAIGRTKVLSNPEIIMRGARLLALGEAELTKGRRITSSGAKITINAGVGRSGMPAGTVWVRYSTGKKGSNGAFITPGRQHDLGGFTWSGRRFRKAMWNDINDATQDYKSQLPGAIKKIGNASALGAQSWLQIADALGVSPESIPGGRTAPAKIAKARKALAVSGKVWINGSASAQEHYSGFQLMITNSLPYWNKLGFDSMLMTLMRQEVKKFDRNFQAGANFNFQQATKKYPYFKLLSGETKQDQTNDI